MTFRRFQFIPFIVLCGVLAGCSSAAKKQEIWQLYDIPAPVPVQQSPYGRPAYPLDNDSYYQPPRNNNSCNTISDNPSCGGG